MDPCQELIKTYTGKKYVSITSRGNTAIDAALKFIKPNTTIIIPDQGGWIHFERGPKKVGLKVRKIKTDYGIIDPKECKDAAAILYSAYAGYFAKQDTKKIYEACKNNNILVILDISAAVTDTLYADIFVASCKKLINHTEGGFIASDSKIGQSLEGSKELEEKLKAAPTRLKQLQQKQKKIKQDLKKHKIFHKQKVGTAVAVEYNKQVETYAKEHNLHYIRCPKSIKIQADALWIDTT